MRPQSITMFDRLFLGSTALGLLNTAISFDSTMELIQSDPATAGTSMAGPGFVIASAAVGVAISLLLWFLVARKASNVAKWILTVLTVLGAAMLPFSLGTLGLVTAIFSSILTVMQLAGIYFLFRPDAKAWFDHGPDGMDTTVFD
ncbi:MAG: hypothetical protein NBV60_03520 [Erythrobacter sp.]|nr:hypothetical protein [Erythrobacter sp.]